MKTNRLIFMILFLTGCEGPIINQNHNPVKQQNDGTYVYDFRFTEDYLYKGYIKVYGEQKLKSLSLIPEECANHIDVLYEGGPNNGWAFIVFKCKPQKNK